MGALHWANRSYTGVPRPWRATEVGWVELLAVISVYQLEPHSVITKKSELEWQWMEAGKQEIIMPLKKYNSSLMYFTANKTFEQLTVTCLLTSHPFLIDNPSLIENQILELSEHQGLYSSFHKCVLLASLRWYSALKLNTALLSSMPDRVMAVPGTCSRMD